MSFEEWLRLLNTIANYLNAFLVVILIAVMSRWGFRIFTAVNTLVTMAQKRQLGGWIGTGRREGDPDAG